jgi:TPR repeat protein
MGLSQAKQLVANLEPLPISISNIAKKEEVGCYSLTCKVTNNSEDKEVNNFVVMKASSNSDWRKIFNATQEPLSKQSQHEQHQSKQKQQEDSQIQYPLAGYLFSTSNKEPVAMSIGTDVAWILPLALTLCMCLSLSPCNSARAAEAAKPQEETIEKKPEPISAGETPPTTDTATSLESAKQAVKDKDYTKAIGILQSPSLAANAEAQYYLGLLTLNGWGITKNTNEATSWLTKSAEQKFAKAQTELGMFYLSGKEVIRDTPKAIVFLQQAAEQSDTTAQVRLGQIYQNGEGVGKDADKAFTWYQKAATTDSAGKHAVSLCYHFGIGVAANKREAFSWCKKAAEDGNAKAQYDLGRYYELGNGVERNGKEALKWFQKSAALNDPAAQNKLGHIYMDGVLAPKDIKQATLWLQKAATAGNAEAKETLLNLKTPSPTVCYKKFMAAVYYGKTLNDFSSYLTRASQAAIMKMSPAEKQAIFLHLKKLYIGDPKIISEKHYGNMVRLVVGSGTAALDGARTTSDVTSEIELLLEDGYWKVSRSVTTGTYYQ